MFNRTTGELIRGNNGMVHMEKNWGDSFPESWIWAQGAVAQPQKVCSPLRLQNIGVTFLCKWSFVSHRTL